MAWTHLKQSSESQLTLYTVVSSWQDSIFYNLKFNLVNQQNWNQFDWEKFHFPRLAIVDLCQFLLNTQLSAYIMRCLALFSIAGPQSSVQSLLLKVKVKKTHFLPSSFMGTCLHKAQDEGMAELSGQLCVIFCQPLHPGHIILPRGNYDASSFLLKIFLQHK